MRSSGQSFMPDYLASLVVFGILITMFLSSWNTVLSNQTVFAREDQMRMRGLHTTTFLVATPGYPENWEEQGVKVVVPGFANPDHVLQQEKLEAFRELSYSEQKDVLQARNFYLSIRNDSTVLELNGKNLTYGRYYGNAETVIPFTRTVQVNLSGNLRNARMRYVVWE